MSISRDSLSSSRRHRSNTHSTLRPPSLVQSIHIGDSRALAARLHSEDDHSVLINPDAWPGIAEGDLVEVASTADVSSGTSSFLFCVKDLEKARQPRLQLSIPQKMAEKFRIARHPELLCRKVNPSAYEASHVEFTFKDQYLGRADMWRLTRSLNSQCVYLGEEISVPGLVSATVQGIYIKGCKASSALVSACTKPIFRSLSARVIIFVQICKELWEFAHDGEKYYEKVAHSFLPSLFLRWKESGCSHTVTIVLVARIFYAVGHVTESLRQDDTDSQRWYKDFYKVITDLETVHDWNSTLGSLKDSFITFEKNVLTRCDRCCESGKKLCGLLSYAHEGPILEAVNMTLNPTELHYIDRSLSMTGMSNVFITPGTGHFRVNKSLLRLTTMRMLDQGFGLDLISLRKSPLHSSPVFSFKSCVPDSIVDPEKLSFESLFDKESQERMLAANTSKICWWEPFWITMTFWDLQMDMPFRADRFIESCKINSCQVFKHLAETTVTSRLPLLSPIPTFENEIPIDERRLEAVTFDDRVFKMPPHNIHHTGQVVDSVSSSAEKYLFDLSFSNDSGGVSLPKSQIAENSRRTIIPIEEKISRETSSSPYGDRTDKRPDLLTKSTIAAAVVSKNEAQSSQTQPFSGLETSVLTTPHKSSLRERSSLIPFTTKLTPSSWLINPFRPIINPSLVGVPTQVAGDTMSRHDKRATVSRHSRARPIPHRSSTFHRRSRPYSDLDTTSPQTLRISALSQSNSPSSDFLRSTTPLGRSPASYGLDATQIDPFYFPRAIPFGNIALAKRWKDAYPRPSFKHEIKWKSLVTPACLPLTTEYFPSQHELDTSYDVFTYDFVLQPSEVRSFFLRQPAPSSSASVDREISALATLRTMTAWRLAQGFQFVVRPSEKPLSHFRSAARRSNSFLSADDAELPKPLGASDILTSIGNDPLYLSMSDEIHRLSYVGDSIHVKRYVRRRSSMEPFRYECVVWPKHGAKYENTLTSFPAKGTLDEYGWNRMDMLIAGYERSFSDSMKYWRTRFIVLPSSDPLESTSVTGDLLNVEETRLLGMDKLSEIFGKYQWLDLAEKEKSVFSLRFLPTWLEPSACVSDGALLKQLDAYHELGPLKKKAKSDKAINGLSMQTICTLMRQADPPLIKDYLWNNRVIPSTFSGYDMVGWLVREFTDISTREEAVEIGTRLMREGLFEHHMNRHGFLDGHFFYCLQGDYATVNTPRIRWWRNPGNDEKNSFGEASETAHANGRRGRRLILSQQLIVDADPGPLRKSDCAEVAMLHHDIIHNVTTGFHFELHWIGTSARCLEEMVRSWQSRIEKYGLRLVEAYVDEVISISQRNPFQSVCPIQIVLPPPVITELPERLPNGKLTKCLFENAILTQEFDFVLDIESTEHYPKDVDVYYSYRRSAFRYSQYVHKSGVAFVQVLGGEGGYVFLANRLLQQSRKESISADQLRRDLHEFCSNPEKLTAFYSKALKELQHWEQLPEPSKLSI